MQFDQFTVCLLHESSDQPQVDPQESAALQDAHLANLARLHDEGSLLAAGPLRDERYCGLSILAVDVETGLRLMQEDPLVRAGTCEPEVVPWLVPSGVISFPPDGRLPRSVAEASAD